MASTFSETEQVKAAEAFGWFLRAVYLKRGGLDSLYTLDYLVVMADYYLALPIVSSFVNLNLLESHGLTSRIASEPVTVLIKATQLRSCSLFREAFIHVVGQWSQWTDAQRSQFKTQTASRYLHVYSLVLCHHGKLRAKVAQALWTLQSYQLRPQGMKHAWFADLVSNAVLKIRDEGNVKAMSEPEFFRKIYSILLEVRSNPSSVVEAGYSRRTINVLLRGLANDLAVIKELLQNNLVFGSHAVESSGWAQFDYLVCTQLDIEEFPWDMNETDW